jgi:hypothetical protein
MSNWIEHDGTGCAFPEGTPVCAVFRDGLEMQFVVDATDQLKIGLLKPDGGFFYSCWSWAVNGRPECDAWADIIRYRREDAARDTRQALFESWLNLPVVAPEVEPA